MEQRSKLPAVALTCALLAASASQTAAAPFEGQLLRLAEVLGSIHFLRNLCGEESDIWREQMTALLEAESPSPDRRARLVASFNYGYRTFEGSYKTCTDSAIEAIRRYMEEGERLSREIALRYGD